MMAGLSLSAAACSAATSSTARKALSVLRQPMIAGERFHPVLVVGRAPTQHLFVHHRNANHLTEEVNHLLGPRQPAEVTVNDDAVEAVVDEGQQIAEQLGEQFHGNPLQARSG